MTSDKTTGEVGSLDFNNTEGWARVVIDADERGDHMAATAAIIIPGVLQKVTEIKQREFKMRPECPPIFVLVALRLDEARATGTAIEVFGPTVEDPGSLADAVTAIEAAIDLTMEHTDHDYTKQRCHDCQTIGREPCDLCPENDDETGG